MINPFKSKKGLGRGLSSLIGDSDRKTSNQKISISSIVPNKNQPRKMFEKNVFGIIEKTLLIVLLVATLASIGQIIGNIIAIQEVNLADILLLFIYIEVIGMIGVFWASKTIRITYPVLIAITALARLIILQDKDSASINLIYQGGAILLLALSVFFLTLRYSKKLGMDKKSPGEEA